MSDQRNLILAIVLSVGIIQVFQYFYETPRVRQAQEEGPPPQTTSQQEDRGRTTAGQPPRPDAGEGTPQAGTTEAQEGVGTAAGTPTEEAQRIPIDNGRLRGSLSLTGGRIDDLKLIDYRVEVDQSSPPVTLLSPVGSENPYFAEFGWVAPDDDGANVPGSETVWQGDAERLAPGDPVVLSWENGNGLRFEREIALDENYMFTITQRVVNTSGAERTLYPYGLVSRWGTPDTLGFFILHEGPIGVLKETLEEIDYGDVRDDGPLTYDSTGGWLGFTDKYWLAALVPGQNSPVEANFRHNMRGDTNRYQTDFLRDAVSIPAGGSTEVTSRLFAGAKEVSLLDGYAAEYDIPLFDRAVDFGWFYFLTKPFFHALHWLFGLVGNYGVAILILTLGVKLVFYPLANKSYRSMSQMKKLQPEMQKLREQYQDDREKMSQELMALYRREKVNPMAGCLPIVIQIPVFFALYKVLFVSIEMRHAPFFGWIQDLSAPDPTTLFNLFGLFPWDAAFLPALGVWPLLMGLTMFLQTKLNPTPPDPMQARIMLFLPLIFIFLFATFPAGLVIYWTWNNLLSIAQQWVIMKRMNVDPVKAATS